MNRYALYILHNIILYYNLFNSCINSSMYMLINISCRIQHDNQGFGPGWFLDRVSILSYRLHRLCV